MSDDDDGDDIDPSSSSARKRAKSKSSKTASTSKSASARRKAEKGEKGEKSAGSKSTKTRAAAKGGDNKVLVLKLTMGLFVLMVVVAIYKVASPPPPPPPPVVIDDTATLKRAQDLAKQCYRKADEAQAAFRTDRAKGERLIKEAIALADQSIAVYTGLFDKYQDGKYEYLGPQFDQLIQAKKQYRGMITIH